MRRSIQIRLAEHEAVIVKRVLLRAAVSGDLTRKAQKAIGPAIEQLEVATRPSGRREATP